MESHASKKDFFYIVVLILTFITFVVGMAFAMYTWIFSQKEGTSSVYTGTLSVEYLSGNVITSDAFVPIEKPNFDTTDNVFRCDFKVKNTGTLDSMIDIYIDAEVNEFSDGMLKFILYNSDGDELATGDVNDVEKVILASNVSLESRESQNYVLVVWLNETNEDQNLEMRKNMIGTVVVDASQQIE